MRLGLPVQGVWACSLVGELGSHVPWGQENQVIKQKQYCNKLKKDFKSGPLKKKFLKKGQIWPIRHNFLIAIEGRHNDFRYLFSLLREKILGTLGKRHMVNNDHRTCRKESNHEKAEEINKLNIKTKTMLGL